MGWTNEQTIDLTLPPGGNPNLPHRVIGPDIPAIISGFSPDYHWLFVDLWYYDATQFAFQGLAMNTAFGISEWITGIYTTAFGVQLMSFVEGPGGGGNTYNWGTDFYDTERLSMTWRNTDMFIGATSALTIDSDVTMTGTSIENDTWHALGLQHGWLNYGGVNVTAQYRLVPSPARNLQVVGLIHGGVTADGTVVGNVGILPAHVIPGWGGTSVNGARSCRVDLLQNGDLAILGVGAGGDLALNETYSLDA